MDKQKLEQFTKLSKLYYDPKIGFTDVSTLFQNARDSGIKLTLNEVKEWYKQQTVNQIYKNPPKVKSFNKIYAHHYAPGEFQMDLMDLSRFYRENKGYRYLLNIIDLYSRYAWSFPLKHKMPDEIAPYVEHIILQLKKLYPKNFIKFTMDNGSEFKGAVNQIFQKYDVKKYLNDPHALNQHHVVGVIERFNGTILNKLKKYMNYYNTLSYVDVLPFLLENYNNTIHSSTSQKPIDIFLGKAYPIIKLDSQYVPPIQNYQIGDKVRYLKVKKIFDKAGFVPNFTESIFTITDIKNNKCLLSNGKWFYPEQLVHATDIPESNQPNDTFIEKMKENKKNTQFERKQKEEFKDSLEKIQSQIIEGKRVRKPVQRFINQ